MVCLALALASSFALANGLLAWGLTFRQLAIRGLIVIAPHPDDESLGCGGLIAAEVMLRSRKFGRPELGILGAVLVGVAAVVICLAVAKPV